MHSVASRLRVCNSVILVQRKIIVPKLLDNSSQRDYVANFIYNRNICFSWYYNREGNTDHVLQQISALENTDTSEKSFLEGASHLPEKTSDTDVFLPEFKVHKLY